MKKNIWCILYDFFTFKRPISNPSLWKTRISSSYIYIYIYIQFYCWWFGAARNQNNSSHDVAIILAKNLLSWYKKTYFGKIAIWWSEIFQLLITLPLCTYRECHTYSMCIQMDIWLRHDKRERGRLTRSSEIMKNAKNYKKRQNMLEIIIFIHSIKWMCTE